MIKKISVLILIMLFSLCVFIGCNSSQTTDSGDTPSSEEIISEEVVEVIYYKLGLSVESIQKGKTTTLNPYIYENGEIVDGIEAKFSVIGDCVTLTGNELTATEIGEATITSTVTYKGVEYTDSAKIEVKDLQYFASLVIGEKEVNTNISLVSNTKIENQISLKVYNNEEITDYSLAFVGKSDVLIGETNYSLNSLYNVVLNQEVVGQVILAFYVKSGENYVDIINDKGLVKYTDEYKYDYYFGDLVIEEKNIQCLYQKNVKLNVMRNNEIIDLSDITTSEANTMFIAGTATTVSLSNNITYRDNPTIRLNTLGEWYPKITLAGVYDYIKSNHLSEATISFKLYFDIDNADNISLSVQGLSETFLPQGTIEPKKWIDLSINLDKNSLSKLSNIVLLPLMVASSGKVTGSDYSIYFTEFSLGLASYSFDILEFEKTSYEINEITPFKMNVDGDLIDNTNPIINNLEFDIKDKSIVGVKNGQLYPLKNGTTTISVKNDQSTITTTVVVKDAPNGIYFYDIIKDGFTENVFSVVNGSTKAKTDRGSVSLVKDGEDYCIKFEEFAQKGEWYNRYISFNGSRNTFSNGDILKIVFKHNYSTTDNLYFRAYNSQFFTDIKLEERAEDGQMTDWKTLTIPLKNVPQDVDFFFTLCDSEGEIPITILIKDIGIADGIDMETDNGIYSFGNMNTDAISEAFGYGSNVSLSVEPDETYGAILSMHKNATGSWASDTASLEITLKDFVNKANAKQAGIMSSSGIKLRLIVKFDSIPGTKGTRLYTNLTNTHKFTSVGDYFIADSEEGKWVTIDLPIIDTTKAFSFTFLDETTCNHEYYVKIGQISVIKPQETESTGGGLYNFGKMSKDELNTAFGGSDITTFAVVEDETYGAVLKVTEGARQAYMYPFIFKSLYKEDLAEVGNYLHLKVKFLDMSAKGIYTYSYYRGAYNFTNKKYTVNQSGWVDMYLEITSDVQGDWYFEFFDDGRVSGANYASMEMLIATIELTTTKP